MSIRYCNHTWKRRAARVVVLSAFFCVFVLADLRAAVETGETSARTAPPSGEQYAWVEIETFTIPDHLGDIIDKFNGDFDKVVVHIQDANQDQSVQRKISDIIGYLNKEYGIRTVNLEGGVGDYDLRAFLAITGEAIRREVARYFVKKGEINGAEYYAIANPDRILLWGIEDKDLYQACMGVYRSSLEYRDEAKKYLGQLTRIMVKLKKNIYTPEISEMDTAYSAYKAGDMGFQEYLGFLIAKAKRHAIEVRKFPDLYNLFRAQEQEEKIDFETVDKERDTLMDELRGVMPKDEVGELLSSTLEYKTRRITRKEFYGFLLKKARENDIDVKRFPMLLSYMLYIIDYEAVDHSRVMEELKSLEAEITERLFRDDAQRRLYGLSRNLALMKNIFGLRMSKSDYRYYRENKSSFEVRNFMEFILREGPRYRIEEQPDTDIYKLDEYREDITRFYEYSFKRNEAFLKNMRFDRKRVDKSSAILITGSIHAENICDLMEKEDMSYISILPKLANMEGFGGAYSGIFAGYITGIAPDVASGRRADGDND